jgi:hypothetical protein
MTPFPKDVGLRMAHARRVREKTHLQNNNRAKPEQLKLERLSENLFE